MSRIAFLPVRAIRSARRAFIGASVTVVMEEDGWSVLQRRGTYVVSRTYFPTKDEAVALAGRLYSAEYPPPAEVLDVQVADEPQNHDEIDWG